MSSMLRNLALNGLVLRERDLTILIKVSLLPWDLQTFELLGGEIFNKFLNFFLY